MAAERVQAGVVVRKGTTGAAGEARAATDQVALQLLTVLHSMHLHSMHLRSMQVLLLLWLPLIKRRPKGYLKSFPHLAVCC